ncbi:MAG: hypothetical protein PWP74_2126 [Shewanella sp.]|nr:hypothetical protein [Shewanella sp.]
MDMEVNTFVKSMANVTIPEEILKAVDMKGLLKGFSKDYKKLDGLKDARAKHESRNFIGRWWNNDELENAKLDASELQASFSKKLGQLMVLSVAQSKQLASQQEELSIQQEVIQEQTQQLADSAEHIQNQQTELSAQNSKLEQLVNEYFELKGLTQEGAIQLIKIANEVKQTKDELLTAVEQQITDVHQSQQQLQRDVSENVEAMLQQQTQLKVQVDTELDERGREMTAALQQSLAEVEQLQGEINQSLTATETRLNQAQEQSLQQQQQALIAQTTQWQQDKSEMHNTLTANRQDLTAALQAQQRALADANAVAEQHFHQLNETIASHQAQLEQSAAELALLRDESSQREATWQKNARKWLMTFGMTNALLVIALIYLAFRVQTQQPLF